MEDRLREEKRAALQTYFGTASRAEDGVGESFCTDDRRGFFWVLTREECTGNNPASVHSYQLAIVPHNGVDYFIFGEHPI